MKFPFSKKQVSWLFFFFLTYNLFSQPFTDVSSLSILPEIYNTRIAWADFDNDDDLDFFIAGRTISSRIFSNDGSDVFTLVNSSFPVMELGFVAPGDYDNDNDIDLLISGWNSGDGNITRIYRNNGGFSFTYMSTIPLPVLVYSSGDWADYDNDGDLDILISGNSSEGDITKVYTNNGNSTFTESGISLTAVSRGTSAWIDFDKDNDFDIFISGSSISKLYINNGDKTFSESSVQFPGINNGEAAWGDYDNDGYIDVVLAHTSGTSVFKNLGDGSFEEQAEIIIPQFSSSSLDWGDYNNDGNIDLAINGMQGTTRTTKIYKNNGDNSFTDSGISLLGITTGEVQWADYDADGDLDIIISGTSASGNKYTRLYRNDINNINLTPSTPDGLQAEVNNRDILFKWDKSTDDHTPASGLSYNIRVGTTTGGYDIVTPVVNSSSFFKKASLGNCQYDTSSSLKSMQPNTYYWSVQALDNSYHSSAMSTEHSITIDSIQASQLRTSIFGSESLLVRWKRGNGNRCAVFCKEGALTSLLPAHNTTYIGDNTFGYGDQVGTTGWYCIYNGRNDSVVISGLQSANSYSIQVIEYLGSTGSEIYYRDTPDDSRGTFSTSVFTQLSTSIRDVTYGAVRWCDYDNDGDLDIALSGYYSGTEGSFLMSTIMSNNGDNTFTMQYGMTGLNLSYLSWADYDNDNLIDIAVSGRTATTSVSVTKIYRNNGTTFYEVSGIDLPDINYGETDWCDYDNDGDLDLLISGLGLTEIVRNDGDNTLTVIEDLNLDAISESSARWGDYNNDGKSDFIIAGSGISKIYKNEGNDVFTEQTEIVLPGISSGCVRWGDYNNDGYPDILLTGENSTLGYICKILKNNKEGDFIDLNLSFTGTYNGETAWVDYDNDGDLDVFITGATQPYNGSPISYFYQNKGGDLFIKDDDVYILGFTESSVDFGDFDNDGDNDMLITGYANGSGSTRIYKNSIISNAGNIIPNNAPSSPTGTSSVMFPGGVSLSWDPASDHESSISSISYNVKIGTQLNSEDIVSSHSSSEGFRKVSKHGNSSFNEFCIVEGLPSGKYYWNVQSVDQGFKGSTWSAVDSFEIKNVQTFFSYDTVCIGYPTTFIDQSVATDGIASWYWDFKDGETSSEQNPVHMYSASGSYNVKLIITDNGGAKDSLEQEVIVLPRPITGFSAPDVCQGIPVTATNTTDNNGLTISSWYWDFGDGDTSTDQQPSPHPYLTAGDYSIKLKTVATNGCADSVTNIVSVGAYPVAAVTANAPLTFCEGDSVTLSVPYADTYSYNWMLGGTSITGGDSSKYIAKLTGDYSVEIVNPKGNCLSTSSDVSVTSNEAPTAPLISADGDLEFCQSDSVILSVTNNNEYSYQWKLNGGAVGIDSSRYIAKSSGTYSLTVSNSTGCSVDATNTIDVIVNPAPTLPTVNISGPTTFCEGDNVELSVTNNPDYTYQWENNSAAITGATTNSYTAQNSGVYTLKITNSSGCFIRTEDVTVNVLDAPSAPLISTDGDLEFCQGDSVILSVTTTAGNTYQWKLNGGAVGSDSSRYSAKASGTYSLTVSNSTGCSVDATNTIDVIVNPAPTLPTVNISGPTTFCEGDNVELSVTNNPDYTYQWENNSAAITGETTNSYIAQNSGVYTLKITNSSGCFIRTEDVTVNVLDAPSAPLISTDGDLEFCQGDSVVLSVTPTAGYTYQWKLNGGAVGTDSSQYCAKSSGTYSLTVSNSTGCSVDATNTVSVTVNPVPTLPTVNISGPTTFCEGDTVGLSVTDNPAYTYQWENNGSLITGDTSNSYKALTTGTYKLNISNSYGCVTITSPVTVTVKPMPYVPVITSDNYNPGECMGETPIRLYVDQEVPGYSYQWYRNGIPVAGETLSYIEDFLTEGDYSLEADLDGCTAESDIMNVYYEDAPDKPFIHAQGPTVWYLVSSDTTGSNYRWYCNGNLIERANKYYYIAGRKMGDYQVSISNSLGCFTRSEIVTIPTGDTGMDDVDPFEGLKIYPNPTNGLFVAEIENGIMGNLFIKIISQDGKELYNFMFEKSSAHFIAELNISEQHEGYYLIIFDLNKHITVRRIIID